MGNRIVTEIASIAAMIVGVAIIAVIVSKKADTANVVTNAGKAFANIVSAAVKPVS